MLYEDLIKAIVESNDTFVSKFKEFLLYHKMTISEFCEATGLRESTIYKIMSNPTKDFRVSTLRQILQGARQMEGYETEGIAIGIITAKEALDVLSRKIEVGGRQIKVKEYPATTIEEEIIQGVRAEREGVKGIICGPVAATTLEKVVNIPVIAIRFEMPLLLKAIENIVKKM